MYIKIISEIIFSKIIILIIYMFQKIIIEQDQNNFEELTKDIIFEDVSTFGPPLVLMAKANVDPAELRRFAQDLARFNNDLQGLVSSLHSKMQGLEATWRDQEQKKFAEAFAQTTKALGNFLEALHQHVIFLGKKATLVEDYLKQR